MFGPLIDAPPSHPDTILTTLVYMHMVFHDMGMRFEHVSVDLQLFAVLEQILWNDNTGKFSNGVSRLGPM
jgi:hypothetical protein